MNKLVLERILPTIDPRLMHETLWFLCSFGSRNCCSFQIPQSRSICKQNPLIFWTLGFSAALDPAIVAPFKYLNPVRSASKILLFFGLLVSLQLWIPQLLLLSNTSIPFDLQAKSSYFLDS